VRGEAVAGAAFGPGLFSVRPSGDGEMSKLKGRCLQRPEIERFKQLPGARALQVTPLQRTALEEETALEEDSPILLLLLILIAMRRTRKGRAHGQRERTRRVQQMAKLRRKVERRTVLYSPPSRSGGRS
jgi:hypothetical protein